MQISNNLQLADSGIHGNAIGSPIYISVCVFVLAAYLHSCLMISKTIFSRYSLNATVSDGRFSVTVGVSVQVEQATDEMVQNAVTLRFQDLSPEDLVGVYMEELKKVLRTSLDGDGTGVIDGPDPLHILGVQPLSRSSQLEVLLAVETPDGGYMGPGELALKLEEVKGFLKGALRVVSVLDQSCSGELECGERVCELTLSLDPIGLVTYTTSRVSFVSPRFSRKEMCTCPG